MKNKKWLVFILLVSIMTFVGCTNKEDVSTNQETEENSNLVEDVEDGAVTEEGEDNSLYFTHEEIKEKWNQAADRLGVKDKISDYKMFKAEQETIYSFWFDEGLSMRLITGEDHYKIYSVDMLIDEEIHPTIKERFYKLVIYTVYPEASEEDVEYILNNVEESAVKFEDLKIHFVKTEYSFSGRY